MDAYFTVDVERDLRRDSWNGVTQGLPLLLKLLKKHKINATFFVTGETLKKYPSIFKTISREHEIALHGYTHRRFDTLSLNEKQKELSDCIDIYKKLFKGSPKGFRAPQYSKDKQTLDLLNQNGFIYDSSESSWNIVFLRHLFRRNTNKLQVLKTFIGRKNLYKVRSNLYEVPKCSPLISLGAFELKILPKFLSSPIFFLYKIFGIPLNFVMHSWDLIDLPESRTSQYCGSHEFELKLEGFMLSAKKKGYKFKKIESVIKDVRQK